VLCNAISLKVDRYTVQPCATCVFTVSGPPARYRCYTGSWWTDLQPLLPYWQTTYILSTSYKHTYKPTNKQTNLTSYHSGQLDFPMLQYSSTNESFCRLRRVSYQP